MRCNGLDDRSDGGVPLTQSKPHITSTTHTLPFDKLSPREFERLCLWLVEREGFERAENWRRLALDTTSWSEMSVSES